MRRSEAAVSQLVSPLTYSAAIEFMLAGRREMSALQSLSITEMLQRGAIEDVDVLRLKSALHTDYVICADEAESLITLNETCQQQHRSWPSFYVDTLADYFVAQLEPEGYLTVEKAKRLTDRIAPQGIIARRTDFDLLVRVIDKARWSPVSLTRLALQQVKLAITEGKGPLRVGATLEPGTIRESDVEQIRRILYAHGGDRPIAITRAEADELFDINEAIADPEANAAWTDLYVKAVTNVVMAVSGHAAPTREEALRRDAWLMEAKGELSPLALLSAMVSSSLEAVRPTYREQSSEERALARLEQQRVEIITNEEIEPLEAGWLSERIGRDGRLSPNEAALVAYLERETPHIHPALQATVARLAHAA